MVNVTGSIKGFVQKLDLTGAVTETLLSIQLNVLGETIHVECPVPSEDIVVKLLSASAAPQPTPARQAPVPFGGDLVEPPHQQFVTGEQPPPPRPTPRSQIIGMDPAGNPTVSGPAPVMPDEEDLDEDGIPSA